MYLWQASRYVLLPLQYIMYWVGTLTNHNSQLTNNMNTTTPAKKADDIYNEDNEVKSPWMKWGKPGDNIMGTLISRERRENEYGGKKEMQTIYEIKVMSGGR